MERDFMADAGGYDIPQNIPKTTEGASFQYYQHPRGINDGFIGKLNAKYKDANGKACTQDAVGAQFSHFSLPLWIQIHRGTSSAPMERMLIKPNLELVDDVPVSELYFPLWLPVTKPSNWDDKMWGTRVWSIQNMFAKLKVKEMPQYDVVKEINGGLKKITDYEALAKWYGIPVRFYIDYKEDSQKQTRYITELNFINLDRLPKDALTAFEARIDAKVDSERREREAKKDSYTADTPDVNTNDLLNDDAGELSDFLQ